MDTQEKIESLNIKMLKEILSDNIEGADSLSSQMKTLIERNEKRKVKEEKKDQRRYEQKVNIEKQALILLTKEVQALSLEKMEQIFTYSVDKIWEQLHFLLIKGKDFHFGNESGSGLVLVKQKDKRIFIRYRYFCYDRKELDFNFVNSNNLNEIFSSVVITHAEASYYESTGGHGFTTAGSYGPYDVFGDVLSSFLDVLLSNSKQYYKNQDSG